MENVDEILKKARGRFPTSTSSSLSWLTNHPNDLNRAKRAVAETLRSSDSTRTNVPRRQLDSSSSSGQTEDDEVVTLLKLMTEQPHRRELIISAFLSDGCIKAGNSLSRENHVLLMAAENGSISKLKRTIEKVYIDVLNRDWETPLHLAAEFEHVKDVGVLLELGATIRADKHGCTPLHSAAMAITPNVEIAELLIQAATGRGENFWMLNKQSNRETGENTALHLVAGNVNVTAEFIEKLKDTDPRIQNSEADTAFHVAAKSSNANVIMYLLTTFRPTNAGWSINSVDEERGSEAPTLVNMCAGNGNAEAVALLIQQGAEVLGVLHEIVVESVLKPKRMDQLLAVYQVVVDNAVKWRCLRDSCKCVIRGSSKYNGILRETMTYLTTKPYRNGMNMIERAIELGASEMLTAILTTDNVCKFDRFGVRKFDPLQAEGSYSRYDVTDFVASSIRPEESKTTPENPAVTEMDFTKHYPPKIPYLEQFLLHRDKWKNKNVLEMQPLQELTKPYFSIVRRCYLILGLMHLVFMTLFTVYYIPDNCTMAGMFGSGCNVSSLDGAQTDKTRTNSTQSASRELPSGLWFIWPVIIIIGGTAFSVKLVRSRVARLSNYYSRKISRDHIGLKMLHRLTPSPINILLGAATKFPIISFCFSVFVWYYRYAYGDVRKLYLEALSMVFLFGWMVTFVLFSRITEHFSVFLIVLNKIIVEDILMSFVLVFVCSIVGFSFALHALRLKSETAPDEYLRLTVYDVFVTALGIGSFFEDSREVMDNRMGLFRMVFAFYVCFTSIILLSVLIAMMSRRYDEAKRGAESDWRLEVIEKALIFQDLIKFSKCLPTAKSYFPCCYFASMYEDNNGRHFVDVKLDLADGERSVAVQKHPKISLA